MTRNPKLTKKRSKYVEERASGILVGSPLTYSAAQMKKYERAIGKLTNAMFREYAKELSLVFRQNEVITVDASISSQARIVLNKLRRRFERLFARNATTIVESVFNGIDKASSATLGQSLRELSGGITLKTDAMPAALRQAMTAAIAENVQLIKSIGQQYHTQIEGAVMRSLQPGGRGMADVREALNKYEGITDRRKDLIARDQVRKVTTAINVERAKSAGITKFRWRHSGGGSEPRQDHVDMDGMVFDYDDPPVIDERTGERGYPGQLINCRCQAVPVLEWGDAEK
jgi:SPP1 gp7 family putative phage head morphogenesis protein